MPNKWSVPWTGPNSALILHRNEADQSEGWAHWVHPCKIILQNNLFPVNAVWTWQNTQFLIYNSFNGALKSSCLSIYLFMMLFNTFCLWYPFTACSSLMNQQWLALKAIQYLSQQCVSCLREKLKKIRISILRTDSTTFKDTWINIFFLHKGTIL